MPRSEQKAKEEMCERRSPGLDPQPGFASCWEREASFIRPGVEMGQGEGNEKHPQPINLLLQLH